MNDVHSDPFAPLAPLTGHELEDRWFSRRPSRRPSVRPMPASPAPSWLPPPAGFTDDPIESRWFR